MKINPVATKCIKLNKCKYIGAVVRAEKPQPPQAATRTQQRDTGRGKRQSRFFYHIFHFLRHTAFWPQDVRDRSGLRAYSSIQRVKERRLFR